LQGGNFCFLGKIKKNCQFSTYTNH